MGEEWPYLRSMYIYIYIYLFIYIEYAGSSKLGSGFPSTVVWQDSCLGNSSPRWFLLCSPARNAVRVGRATLRSRVLEVVTGHVYIYIYVYMLMLIHMCIIYIHICM